jgi:membrane protease YdiL (CAAX protease family)
VTRPEGLREPLLVFAIVTALSVAIVAVGSVVPFVRDNLHVPIAVMFFYAPAVAARRMGREYDYEAAGLRAEPIGLNLALVGLASLLSFPAFVAGFFLFWGRVCPDPALAALFVGNCRAWLGWSGGQLHLPNGFLVFALSQLVVVAIPEELFFRGYLLARLEAVWPPRRRLLGAPVGRALLVSSGLFALGHLVVTPHPQRLAVFFPALLFGWMWARTRSIAAGAAFHALCNIVSELLRVSFFAG